MMPHDVLNLGSINLDRVLRVARVVRPGETIAGSSLAEFAGGKGANQSVALARAGAKVAHVGKVGPHGAWLVEKLAAEGIDTRFIARAHSPTGQAVIQVADDGQNAIVVLAGANREITDDEIDAALASCGPKTWVLTQNETSGVAHAIAAAAQRGLRLAFNPAPFTPAVLDYPLDRLALLIFNETEGAALTGRDHPEAILGALRSRLPTTELLLTLGAEGAMYDGQDGFLRVAASPTTVVDTTAAGDTFIGYFLASRLAGNTVQASLERAARAAAVCVSRAGAMDSIPRANDFQVDGDEGSLHGYNRKVCDRILVPTGGNEPWASIPSSRPCSWGWTTTRQQCKCVSWIDPEGFSGTDRCPTTPRRSSGA